MGAEWNHDITRAPRGRFKVIPTSNGKGTYKVFQPAEIIAASSCGAVCISFWLDDQKRWSMFPAGVQPIAWMPYAGPRVEIDDNGRKRSFIDLPKHPTMEESWFAKLLREQKAAA